MPMRLLSALLLLVVAAVSGGAQANELTIYRCTGADGRLALRDTPCRSGERQQTREMLRPKDPAPRRTAVPAVAATAAPTSTPERTRTRVVVVRPPRPLYECTTPDGNTYTSETDEGDPRWVPLWTLGYPVVERGYHGTSLGQRIGAPRPRPPTDRPGPPRLPPAVGLAYTSGTWVRDRCYALPQREVCDRLRDRDSELRRQYNSALQSERHSITTERRGIDARLATDCG